MNPYASFAAQATDVAGTEHLVWEDNGQLFHARYDERVGAWVEKAPVSDANGGSDLRLVAGNIIPFTSSGVTNYAPGLIAAWRQGVGNASEVHIAVGRYNPQGQLEWSDSIQLSKDDVADLGLDIAVGQNGLMNLVSQKVLDPADPRNSTYKDNPGQLVQDLTSPNQHDTDLYHVPFLIENNGGKLQIAVNPTATTTGKIGTQKELIDLNFAPVSYLALYDNPDPALQVPQADPSRSPSALALQASNADADSGLLGASFSTGGTGNAIFPASTNQSFNIQLGDPSKLADGRLPLWWASRKNPNLGFALSGSITSKTKTTQTQLKAQFELETSNYVVSKDDGAEKGSRYGLSLVANENRANSIRERKPYAGTTVRKGWQFDIDFSGSQTTNNVDGSLYSLTRGVSLSLGRFYQIKVEYPPANAFIVPPGSDVSEGIVQGKGSLVQGRITETNSVEIGLETIYEKPTVGVKGPFKPVISSIAGDSAFTGAVVGGILQFLAESKSATTQFSQGSSAKANANAFGYAALAVEVAAALPIILSGWNLVFPFYPTKAQNEKFGDPKLGFKFTIGKTLSGQVGIIANTLRAQATGGVEFGVAIKGLADPELVTLDITGSFSTAAQIAGFTILGWGDSINKSWDVYSRSDSSQPDAKSIDPKPPQSSLNNGFNVSYNPYSGNTSIYQNKRFAPLGATSSQSSTLLKADNNYGIGSVSLTSGGSGYLSGQSGSFQVLPNIGSAVLIAYVNKGLITQIVVQNPGSGYAATSQVTLDFNKNGGGGTGASGTVTLIDDEIINLVNDGPPFIDSLVYNIGTSPQVTEALIWIADGTDSSKPVGDPSNQTNGQITTRVMVAESNGGLDGIPTAIPNEGSTGVNYDPVVNVFLENGRPALMAVWAHAKATGVNASSISNPNQVLDAILDTDIYYSIRSSGPWSAPKLLVAQPGTDTRLDLGRTQDGKLHLAWVNTKVDASQSSERFIYSSFFDPSTEKWTSPTVANPNISTFQTDSKDVVLDLDGKSTLVNISGINRFQVRPGYKLIRPNGQTYTFATGDSISFNGNTPFIVNINEPVTYQPFGTNASTVTLRSANPVPSFATLVSAGIDNGQGVASLQVGEYDGKPTVYWSDYVDTPYFYNVLEDAPELYFRLEESSTSFPARNYGALGNDVQVSGLYSGNMSFDKTGALGKDPDPAVKFNGQGALAVNVPDSSTLTPQDFSVEVWIKLADTNGGEGIITRGQPQNITATLPQATLTYSITQQQGSDGKWAYVVTADSIAVTNKGKDIFPNTLRVANFNVFDNIDGTKPTPARDYIAQAGDSFLLESGQSIRLTPTAQTIAFAGTIGVSGSQRFSILPGQRVVLPNGQTFIQPGRNDTPVTVSLKVGDKLDIFNNTPSTITNSLQSLLSFTADGTGSLDGISIAGGKQVLAQGTGLNSRPFSDIPSDGNSHSKTASLQFNQIQDWYLATGTGGKIVFNSGSGEISSANLATNQWHHVVGTYDSTTQKTKLYIDGQQVAEKEGRRFSASNNDLLIGNGFTGTLDEVAIYNKALTVADPNAVQVDSQGKYITGIDPNAPGGEITNHFASRNIDPNDAEEGTFYSVWDSTKNAWGTSTVLNPEFKVTPTQPDIFRPAVVDVVGTNGLQPDGQADNRLQIKLENPGQTITKIEISGANNTKWAITKEQGSGANSIAVLQNGKLLNSPANGSLQKTLIGGQELLDLYFAPQANAGSTYKVTVTFANGATQSFNSQALAPNAGQANSGGTVITTKANILEDEVKNLSEVDSGVIIPTSEASAGQAIAAGKIRNGNLGVAIGHPYTTDGNGRVWITPAGSNSNLNDLVNQPLQNDQAPNNGALVVGNKLDGIGHVLAIGDLDKDGIEDLVIGAPDADGGNGKVYVISGKALGSNQKLDLAALPSNSVHTLKGTSGSNAGFALDTGDVDGDGIDDLVIGAPNALDSANKPVGAVHIVFGKSGFFTSNPVETLGSSTLLFQGTSGTVKSDFNLIPQPDQPWYSQVGYAVAVVKPGGANAKAQTFDGDTKADVIIGAPGYHQPVTFNKDGFLKGTTDAQISQYLDLVSHVPNSGSGSETSKALNTGRAYTIFGKSVTKTNPLITESALTNSNGTANKGVIFDGSPLEDEDTRLGESVASAGDLNGDGFIDVVLSAPSAMGQAGLSFVFKGGNASKGKYTAILDSNLLIGGGDVHEYSGQVVKGIGDLNQDKFEELLISAPQAGYATGQSSIIFGNDKLLTRQKAANGSEFFPNVISLLPGASDDVLVLNGGLPQDLAGFGVGKAPDLNGDGVPDVLLTAPFAQQAYVTFGHPWLAKEGSIRLDKLANDQGVIIARYNGSQPAFKNDGKVVADLGDINGDGFADVAVSGNGQSVLIEFGETTRELLDDSSGTNRLAINGRNGTPGNELKSLLPLGDFNGDGLADSVITTTGGKVHFLPGSTQLNSASQATVDLSKPDSSLPQLASLGITLGSSANDNPTYKQSLKIGESIYSPTTIQGGRQFQYRLTLEANGELKFYDPSNKVLWTGGDASLGIVKVEVGTDQGKDRLLYYNKNNDLVSLSNASLDHTSGSIPYLNVGAGFLRLSAQDNKGEQRFRQTSGTLFRENGVNDSLFNNGESTVWGNSVSSLFDGEALTSADGKFSLQVFHNFPFTNPNDSSFSEVYLVDADGKVIWTPRLLPNADYSKHSAGKVRLSMQADGNLVYYAFTGNNTDPVGSNAVWSSGTSGGNNAGNFLLLGQNSADLNLVKFKTDSNNRGAVDEIKNLHGSSIIPQYADLRSAGDLNGDGYEDLVTFDFQHAIILYGRNGGLIPVISFRLLSFDGNVLEAPFAMGGGIGDINGDGYDDLLIQDINGASILLGAQNLGQAVRQDSIPSYLASYQQNNSSPSVYEMGDFNGDGFGDFVVRDRFISGGDKQALRVVLGNASGKDFKSIQVQTFKPMSSPLMSVGSAGDVNGDGLDDLIFADSDANNGQGETYIVFGGKDGKLPSQLSPSDVYNLSGDRGFVIKGLPESLAGQTVSGGGDINGDGLRDFIIGAPGKDGNTALTYALFGGDFNFPKSVNISGTLAGDVLEGTATGEVMLGLSGDDQLVGNGGRDVIYGGVGDDLISVADPNFQRVDGGGGFDVLQLQGYNGQAWDITKLSPGLRIQNIEVIDLTNYGNNQLTLNKHSVLQMTGGLRSLVILGDANDTIKLSSDFGERGTKNVGGTLFKRFTAGSNIDAEVLISPNITSQVLFTAPTNNSPTGLTNTPSALQATFAGTESEISVNSPPEAVTTNIIEANSQPTQFYVTAESVIENDDYLTFKVQRGGDVSARATVIYQTLNDTAIAGKDYVAALGTLAFEPGEIVKEIQIKLLNDEVYEGNNQSFDLQILPITEALAQQLISTQLTVNTQAGSQIRNLEKGTLDPALATALGAAMPLGALNFNVTTLDGKTVLEMPFSGVVGINSYYRLNIETGQYQEFLYDGESGAEFLDSNSDGQTDTLRLHLKDGVWADSDLTENGVIAGSNAPAKVTPGLVTQANGVFFVPTRSDGQLQFHNLTANGDYEMGLIAVDDATGRIGTLQPGDNGYTEAALARKQSIFNQAPGSDLQALTTNQAKQALSNPQILVQSEFEAVGSFVTQQLVGNQHYALYLTQNGQTQFSLGNAQFQANQDGRGLTQVSWGNNRFEVGTPLLVTPGTPGQQLQASIELARGGAYDNTLAFYKVDNLTGELDLNRDGVMDLKPGDVGYSQAALERVQNSQTGLVLPKVEQIFTSRSTTVTLDGGTLYGMVLIPNASVAELLATNPGNSADKAIHGFFSFGEVNPGGNSHIRRLGQNLWGFEDLIGGGDRDYNDIVVGLTWP